MLLRLLRVVLAGARAVDAGGLARRLPVQVVHIAVRADEARALHVVALLAMGDRAPAVPLSPTRAADRPLERLHRTGVVAAGH